MVPCVCLSCQVVFRSVQHLSSMPQQQRIRSDFTLESRVWLITIAGSAPNRCLIKRTRPSRGKQIIHSILPGRKRNENIYFHRCANPFAGVKLKESWNVPRHSQPARHQRPRRTISEPTSCDTSLSCTAAESAHKARKLVTGTTKRAHSRIGEETLRENSTNTAAGKKRCAWLLTRNSAFWLNFVTLIMRVAPIPIAIGGPFVPSRSKYKRSHPKVGCAQKKHAALLSNHLTRSASMLFSLGSNKDLY